MSPSGSGYDTPTRRQLAFSPRNAINPVTGEKKERERPQTATAKPLSFDDWAETRHSPSASPRNPRFESTMITPTCRNGATNLNLEKLKTPEDSRPSSPKISSPKGNIL